jgi:acyl-coenzyme A thioesterase PaaI-like protein
MMELRATADELNAVLAGTPFLEPYRFRVVQCAPGECVLEIPFDPALERPGGIVSGMTLMGAADVAMWLAIMTMRGTREHWVTSDMKTAFLKSGRRSAIRCTATLLKLGRRTAYGTVESRSEGSELLAHHVIGYAKAAESQSP